MQQLLLRRLQLPGALLDLDFEVLRKLVDLPQRGAEALAHHLEGARQLVDFLAAVVDANRLVELHVADRLGAFDQLLDRPAQKAAGEIDDKEPDQRDLNASDQQDAVLHARDLTIHRFERQLQVEDAKHLYARRMRVTGCLAARGLVVDRR